MASTSDFRNGLVIKFNHDLYSIVEFQHVKPGKGAAFVRTKLKNVKTGRVLDNTFPSGTKVETARVITIKHQFLYKDDFGYHFMNTQSYEQVTLEEGLINAPQLLLEGQEADILFHDETDTPLNCEIPSFVVMEITYTEPGVKGDTATNSLKPATVETGATINVPLFINQGEKIKIDTRNNSYVERVK